MLTVFTIPKPFSGHIGLIQRNALTAWSRLQPEVEIVLLGSDFGVAAAAREFNARHLPELSINRYGTPLISDAFSRVRALSSRPFLMYSNADMLYQHDVLTSLEGLRHMSEFMMSGRRWDVDVRHDLSAADVHEWERLFSELRRSGRLHGPAGMDYFIFPRSLDLQMPEFAVGRMGWDSWLIWKCRSLGLPVIDATGSIHAVHQNHDYSDLPLGYQHWRGPERDLNVRFAGGLTRMLTLREASHVLIGGQIKRPSGVRILSSLLATSAFYRWAIASKRWLHQKLH